MAASYKPIPYRVDSFNKFLVLAADGQTVCRTNTPKPDNGEDMLTAAFIVDACNFYYQYLKETQTEWTHPFLLTPKELLV